MGFRKLTKDDIKKRVDLITARKKVGYIKEEFPLYRMKEGDNFIRILPPVDDDPFGLDVYVHSYFGLDYQLVCVQKMLKKQCPVCMHYQMVMKKQGRDEAKKYAPKLRTLFWVLDVSDTPQSKKPLVLDSPIMLTQEIIGRTYDRRTGAVNDITDLNDGREVVFTVEMKNVGSKVMPQYKHVDLGSVITVPEKIAKSVCSLFEVINYPTDDELREIKEVLSEPVPVVVEEDETIEGADDTDDMGNFDLRPLSGKKIF